MPPPIEFLKEKFNGYTKFIINFSDGREIDFVELLTEYSSCSQSQPSPTVTDEETQDEVEKLFFQYCREEGMDDDDIKATSWYMGGVIDFGVWLQSRLSQPGLVSQPAKAYCTCNFTMINRDQETQIPFCFECKKEINESQPVTGYSEEDIKEAIEWGYRAYNKYGHLPINAENEFIQSLKSKPNNG